MYFLILLFSKGHIFFYKLNSTRTPFLPVFYLDNVLINHCIIHNEPIGVFDLKLSLSTYVVMIRDKNWNFKLLIMSILYIVHR